MSYYADRIKELKTAQVGLIATATKLRLENAKLKKALKELKTKKLLKTEGLK